MLTKKDWNAICAVHDMSKARRAHYREVAHLQRVALMARYKALRAFNPRSPGCWNLADLANLRAKQFKTARAWYLYQWDIGQDSDDLFVAER